MFESLKEKMTSSMAQNDIKRIKLVKFSNKEEVRDCSIFNDK